MQNSSWGPTPPQSNIAFPLLVCTSVTGKRPESGCYHYGLQCSKHEWSWTPMLRSVQGCSAGAGKFASEGECFIIAIVNYHGRFLLGSNFLFPFSGICSMHVYMYGLAGMCTCVCMHVYMEAWSWYQKSSSLTLVPYSNKLSIKHRACLI